MTWSIGTVVNNYRGPITVQVMQLNGATVDYSTTKISGNINLIVPLRGTLGFVDHGRLPGRVPPFAIEAYYLDLRWSFPYTTTTTTKINVVIAADGTPNLSLAGGPSWGTWVPIPGSLTNVSAAADGTVWGVNSNGDIYTLAGDPAVWKSASGTLVRISAGSAAHVWGVTSAGEVYRLGSDWELIPFPYGAMTDVSAAADGTVWGVNSDGEIYRYDARDDAGSVWTKIDGNLRRISVGSSRIVWGSTRDGKVYKLGSDWQLIPFPYGLMSDVSAAADGTVWGVNNVDEIYRYDARDDAGSVWTKIAGTLNCISAGSSGIVWGVNGKGNVYLRASGGT